jgi:hypothetical protein
MWRKNIFNKHETTKMVYHYFWCCIQQLGTPLRYVVSCHLFKGVSFFFLKRFDMLCGNGINTIQFWFKCLLLFVKGPDNSSSFRLTKMQVRHCTNINIKCSFRYHHLRFYLNTKNFSDLNEISHRVGLWNPIYILTIKLLSIQKIVFIVKN